jgi:hypothetical protein
MSDHNQRQYRRMTNMIEAFERHKMDLGALVDGLDGLLNSLEGVHESWKDTFLGYWGKLEDARAVAMYNGSPSEDSKLRINDAVSALKLLILDQIDDPIDGLLKIGS